MTCRLLSLLLFLPLLALACTTPPPSPITAPAAAPVVVVPAPVAPDDDHRLVSRQEFQASAWGPLPAVVSWKAEASGVAVTLEDGRVVRLGFAAPGVVRLWVPAGPDEVALSAAARYPSLSGLTVRVRELAGVLSLETPALNVQLSLTDLSWALLRGDRQVLRSAGGPLRAGRRLVQAVDARDALRWYGPGWSAPAGGTAMAKFWVDNQANADATGTMAAPSLFGAGGTLSLGLALDTSYQSYAQVSATAVGLGALNGGLDLLMTAAPQPGAVVESLTGLLGRPGLPPTWAHGTALALPDGESGAFLRKAKLSVQTAVGPSPVSRPRFQSLLAVSSALPLPDLTLASTRAAWAEGRGLSAVLPGAGISLPSVPGRLDWNAQFDDGGRGSPLARMNNRLAGLEAEAAAAFWQSQNPGLRPFVLAGSGAWGTIREAQPQVEAAVGDDGPVLTQALMLGAAGLGTPAVRLNLAPLADPATKTAAFQSLLLWSLAPVLTLDWGADPAAFWASLPEPDRVRLKGILDRRSQFKPFFAQAARQASATGRPAWQPLWYAAPNDAKALAIDDEFLVGDGLLAAPVTGGASSRSVYLPGGGVWFDFWTGEEYGGGKAYELDARPDRPLLFARGGAVVPLRETEVFDEKDVYNPMTVHVFPGGRGSGSYYLDDGRTRAWASGVYWETKLAYDFTQKEMILDHQAVNTTGGLRPDPYILYRVHNVFRPKGVKIDGKPIPLYGESWGITDTDRSAAWYEGDHTLLLKTFQPQKEQTIVMSF